MKDRKSPPPPDDLRPAVPFDRAPLIEDSAVGEVPPARPSTLVAEAAAESVGTQLTSIDAVESFSTFSTDGGSTTVGEVGAVAGEASARNLSPRAVVGDFVLEAELGAGTFAEVYRARHLGSGRLVALKVLRHALAGDETVKRRVLREGEILKGLRHRNLVQVYDVGLLEDGRAFVVMELLNGRTLRDLLTREAPLSPDRAYRLTEQIASGLDAAHRAGIIHRDLKPANIFVVGESPSEQIKLLDFGLARLIDRGDVTQLTRAGDVIGSPAFMAPEQIRDPARADERADLYALGIIAFAMVMGRLPFVGRMRDVLEAQVRTQPEPLPLLGGFEIVIASLLSKDPELRPSSAAELLEQIQAVAEPTLIPSSTWPRLQLPAPDTTLRAPVPPRRQRAWLLAGFALLSLVGLVIVGMIVVRIQERRAMVVAAEPRTPRLVEAPRVKARSTGANAAEAGRPTPEEPAGPTPAELKTEEETSPGSARAQRPRPAKTSASTTLVDEGTRTRARLHAAARRRRLRPQDLRILLPGATGLEDAETSREQLELLLEQVRSAPITEALLRARMKRLLGKLGALSDSRTLYRRVHSARGQVLPDPEVGRGFGDEPARLERANEQLDELEMELDKHRP